MSSFGEKRILAVDDDDAIRALLLTVLRRRGFAVDTAKNGVEALECLERCTYVLLLLDLMMPRMSGWQVLERLATQDEARRPMIVVLTAGIEPHQFDPRLVVGSIRKPFDVELLVDTVTACVSATAMRRQLADCPPSESSEKSQQNKRN